MKNNLELMLDTLLVSSYTDSRTREKFFVGLTEGKQCGFIITPPCYYHCQWGCQD